MPNDFFYNMLFFRIIFKIEILHIYWFAYALVMNHYMYKNREIFLNFPLLYLPNLTYKEIQRSREIETIHVLGEHSLNHVLVVMIKDFFCNIKVLTRACFINVLTAKLKRYDLSSIPIFFGNAH